MEIDIFTVSNVNKKYGDKEVVNIPFLNIEKGKIYAILGPNGSGKSTLLRILNLLERPSSGDISFLGYPLAIDNGNRLEQQRQMVMVMQKTVMFSATVLANVMYGLKWRGLSHSEARVKAMEALCWVGMEDFVYRQARTLSGGEAQRVALARAIVLRPEVIFLDEPTASLDPNSVMQIEDLIGRINREMGTTMIIVTHNLFQARRLSHQCVFLYQGQLVEKGATEELFTSGTDPRTRQFVSGELIY
jgi:tungstate transport system ATP-binding protein